MRTRLGLNGASAAPFGSFAGKAQAQPFGITGKLYARKGLERYARSGLSRYARSQT